VVSGLEFPTAIAFDARGRMYVGEKPGRVRVVRGGELRRQPLVEVPTTVDALEQGLLGLAVSPDDRFVYLYATEPDGATNSVMRVPTTGGRPEVIVDGLTASVYHNGGGLAFDRGGGTPGPGQPLRGLARACDRAAQPLRPRDRPAVRSRLRDRERPRGR
jgi:glucose/arabinose dehydrogenase